MFHLCHCLEISRANGKLKFKRKPTMIFTEFRCFDEIKE